MQIAGFCSTALVVLMLSSFATVCPPAALAASSESRTPAPLAAAPGAGEEAGRGEGFEPESETAKGVEAPATFGPIVTDTAVPIDRGKFAIQPTFGYSSVTDTFSKNWNRRSTEGDFQSFSMDWKLTYGLYDNLEVFVVIPYVYNWVSSGDASANDNGIGDVNLTFKYRLVEEDACRPTITALFSTDFPTGKFDNLNPGKLGADITGSGSYVFTTGFNISKYVQPFMLYANLWYSMPTSFTDDDGHQYPGDFVTLNLAAEYPITQKWIALLELTSSISGARLFGPDTNLPQEALISLVPGIEYMATEKFSLALGVSVDLVGRNTDAAVAPLLSMVYAF